MNGLEGVKKEPKWTRRLRKEDEREEEGKKKRANIRSFLRCQQQNMCVCVFLGMLPLGAAALSVCSYSPSLCLSVPIYISTRERGPGTARLSSGRTSSLFLHLLFFFCLFLFPPSDWLIQPRHLGRIWKRGSLFFHRVHQREREGRLKSVGNMRLPLSGKRKDQVTPFAQRRRRLSFLPDEKMSKKVFLFFFCLLVRVPHPVRRNCYFFLLLPSYSHRSVQNSTGNKRGGDPVKKNSQS